MRLPRHQSIVRKGTPDLPYHLINAGARIAPTRRDFGDCKLPEIIGEIPQRSGQAAYGTPDIDFQRTYRSKITGRTQTVHLIFQVEVITTRRSLRKYSRTV